ncbi:hypothetical protein D081_0947 [Anaerovibrio sp. JC8]|uniref:Nif3-like dinuclear metal center hexameric protein n=1 Tax=Anaerovibrio sp. JC8 TaxID=1240085 RepID=UPI000A0E6BAD|nr:Nif3-like dinuclear metal center hexameric protein [Anaerovibrio sp. JC8]ORU00424.1 hypothetical protein D081_0947 [Anaerovibrio sp. JC8]
MKCQTIMGIMEKLAPKKLAEHWDNPGLQLGSPEQEITKILVCLDVSQPVVEQAIELGADMIISHHPVMLFKGLLSIRTDTYDGAMLQKLLSHNIAVYSAHTNLDIAQGGCNDILAKLWGLEQVEGLAVTDPDTGDCLGRIGCLPVSVSVEDFAQKLCNTLPCNHVRLVKGGKAMVRKVALCSGAGSDLISKAVFKGADVYVTGDLKYHEAQQAFKQGINIIDAGHFATEFPMVKAVADYLRQELSSMKHGADIQVCEDNLSEDFFQVVSKKG